MKFPTHSEWRLKYLNASTLERMPDNTREASTAYRYAYMDVSEEKDKFYSQPLALHMFVPCGEDGVPLDVPTEYAYFIRNGLDEYCKYMGNGNALNIERCIAYQAAEQRLLFEGWEIRDEQATGVSVYYPKARYVMLFNAAGETQLLGGKKVTIDAFVNYFTSNSRGRNSVKLTPTQSAKIILNLPE